MATVFLNGELRSLDDPAARVALTDAGFMHAVGLFETMTARREADGVRVVRVDAHVRRLVESARELQLSTSLRADPLAEAVEHTARAHLEHADHDAARVRLTVTGGDLDLVRRVGERVGAAAPTPTIAILAQRATEYPEELFERGGLAVLADAKVSPFDPTAGHKTLNYWWRLRELQAALGRGASEALVFSVTNHLCGGCVSNAFAVRDGALVTPIARGEEEVAAASRPALPSPVLPGVTRATLLELAAEEGLAIERRLVSIDDVLDADEVFCTNASFGVLPITRVESREIGSGGVGPVTRQLGELLRGADGAG
ncbi:MAG: aminotransferase class IV [Planctomycetota bacterium]